MKNPQGTNSERKETEVQINDLEHNKERSIQPEQQAEKRILKNEDSIRSLWDISKCINIQIIGMPGEEEEQEIENLFEKNNERNKTSLNWQRKYNSQKPRIPNKLDPKKTTSRHIIIKIPKVKDKERILNSAREK